MDDSCAVCADTLEWVAYGSCGHREVCSTCVVRLRFILDDRRCCICKNESPTVFVTKALGDYTRVITDFSAFPAGAAEGQVGAYWYHEDTQAYFDDVDHYRMIKAMCRLSCSICDKSTEDQGSEGAKRRSKFRNIEQLKSHLYHRHRMLMCSLCLEGRKVFICEQKLYTRSQLNQHVSTGDSDVDGSESERGGFMGHPMCEFCRNPFYGDNELYMHMSTEHYTCHICQRQHPGQYDYYKNYDDLEIHFRQEHFLCEDEACLVKKFIVFQSEPEMKRHNAMEHGGHMSRSKRNAALQIPTSFRYRQSSEQDRGRGRGRRFRPDPSGNQLSMAIQASLETAFVDSSVRDSSSGAQLGSEHGETSQADAVKGSLESLTINAGTGPPSSLAAPSQSYRSGPILEESSFPPLSDFEPPETSSRYAQAVGQSPSVAGRLREESFPPLPGADTSSNPKEKQGSEVLVKNTMAARLQLRSKGSVAILNSSQSRATENRERGPSSSASSSQTRPTSNHEFPSLNSANIQPATNQGVLSSSSARLLVKPAREHGFVSPISAATTWNSKSSVAILNSSQSRATENRELGQSISASSSQARPTSDHEFPSLNSANIQPATNQGVLSSSSARLLVNPARENGFVSPISATTTTRNSTSKNKMRHSTSAPNLVEGASSNHPTPMSTVIGNHVLARSSESAPNVEDVHTANKSLVERIRAGLGMDGDRFAAFKSISAEYRQGIISTGEYLSHVQLFGLSHLVFELARLLPDPQKQKELINCYNASLESNEPRENGEGSAFSSKGDNLPVKGKAKFVDRADSSSAKDALTDNILNTVRKLQANYKPPEDVEVLSKDGYRVTKGKLQLSAGEEHSNSKSTRLADSHGNTESPANISNSNPNVGGGGSSKQRRKTSKFQRVRLGDGSVAAFLDHDRSNLSPERTESEASNSPSEGLPVRGVWRNGGGQRLVSNSQKDPTK